MVIQTSWRGQTLTLSFKPNCLTVSLQAGKESTVFSWDNHGRLWTAMLAGISYRRGLNGKTVAKWQTANGGRERRWLETAEAERLLETARTCADGLKRDLARGILETSPVLSPADSSVLSNAALFDIARYRADIQTYHQVYQPVGILPPDQYMAVVLQAAEGCSFNTCTFCNFYKDRRFRIKTPREFQQHAEAVKTFLGDGLSLRRTVFLGDANALVVPMPRLLPLLEITRRVFNVEHLGGIFAFLDGFSAEKKSAKDFAQLAELGLQRIYIGLESGHTPLLRLLKKPGQAEDAVQAVHAMKAGGVSAGVIVLLGAGGRQYARAHVQDTIEVLNRMQLDADDLIYFSELVEGDELEYTRDAYAQNLQPLTPTERIEQGEQIENALIFNAERGVPHISRYDIREFVY
jgi:radical SAM superfamily enzyme YgiQ (UPF0313 family)